MPLRLPLDGHFEVFWALVAQNDGVLLQSNVLGKKIWSVAPKRAFGPKVIERCSKTVAKTHLKCVIWNSPGDPLDPPDQVSESAARTLPSTRAGGQDDSS